MRKFCLVLIQALVVVTVSLAPRVATASNIVARGFDLFETAPGTQFHGVPFTGVPLGSFNFGGTIGAKPTGTTDTIVRRPSQAMALPTGPTPIPLELIALHLMTAHPVDLGFGTNSYFLTLQSERGGFASVGTMTITFGPEATPHGTFDSFFDVFFDVRLGSLSGPIVQSGNERLTSTNIPWGHFPSPDALEIQGVNTFLNGTDRSEDFWPTTRFDEVDLTTFPITVHVVDPGRPSAVPEPGSLLLLSLGVLATAGCRLGRRGP